MAFKPSDLVSRPKGARDTRDGGHSEEHPGFQAVEKKIGQREGIRNPGAVLAAATRRASPAAKAANPRLKRVKG